MQATAAQQALTRASQKHLQLNTAQGVINEALDQHQQGAIYNNRSFCGWELMMRMQGSVLPISCIYAILAATLCYCVAEGYISLSGIFCDDLEECFGHPYGHQVFGVVFGYLLVFRSNLAYSRHWEAVGSVELMFSKWGDAIQQICVFDTNQPGSGDAALCGPAFRRHVVHLGTLLSATAVMELQQHMKLTQLWHSESCDLDSHIKQLVVKLDIHEGETLYAPSKLLVLGAMQDVEVEALLQAPALVTAVMQRLLDVVIARQAQGGLKVPPPILSRVFQELSNGMLGFNQAHKLAKVQFPFAFAQLVQLCMYFFILTLPILVASLMGGAPIFATIVTFVVVLGFYSILQIAQQIEMPFGTDTCDIPLAKYHHMFCKELEQQVRKQGFEKIMECDRAWSIAPASEE